MRRLISLVVVLIVVAVSANAQTPNVAAYFDANLTQQAANCPPGPGPNFGKLYIATRHYSMFLIAIEFQVTLPSEITHIGETVPSGALKVGSSPTGIALTFATPQNAFDSMVVLEIDFVWNCSGCTQNDVQLIVNPNPVSGQLRAIRWPDSAEIEAVGMTSLVCASVDSEPSTWGKIKNLYR